MSIGEGIKARRLQSNMTLEELADALNEKFPGVINFNKGKLSKWENGKEEPRLSSIKLIADFFNITIDDLYNSKVEDLFSEQEEMDIQKRVEELMSDIKNGNYILEGEELSEDAKESLRGAFENAVRTAKLINRNTK